MTGRSGGYVASVTLTREGSEVAEKTFDVPLAEDLYSEDEALREGMQYGIDLVDGLLAWFDPQSMCGASRAA
jgi:hypothetical protein